MNEQITAQQGVRSGQSRADLAAVPDHVGTT